MTAEARFARIVYSWLMAVSSLFCACPSAKLAEAEEVDVYILAGQSNMQGIAQLKNAPHRWKQPLETTQFWNGSAFEALNPSSTRISTRPGEFGPELGLVHGLRRAGQQQALYLVKFHRSGQPLHHGWDGSRWVGGAPAADRRTFYPGKSASDPTMGVHYQQWLEQIQTALSTLRESGNAPRIRGVVWMQGEQDSKHEESASVYAASLKRLRERLSEDLQVGDLPWVFGQVLPHTPALPRFTHRQQIRTQMAAVDERSGAPESARGIRMVSTDGFGMLPDSVHYSADGQRDLGLAFARELIAMQRGPLNLKQDLEKAGLDYEVDDFHGHELIQFEIASDVKCRIACPDQALESNPWVWRARFWGHEPQFDLAMLERGWHVAYCDVADLFGCDDALDRWDAFYLLSQKLGLHPRPVLEAMSRGGLVATRWAEKRPAQVGGIYLDNAVLDIRSWPGGKGVGVGHEATWKRCLLAYGATEDSVLEKWQGPLERLQDLAEFDVPMFVLMNLEDNVVPPKENGEKLVNAYQELGGPILVMRRPGLGHHPHSLKDPQPLVEFASHALR